MEPIRLSELCQVLGGTPRGVDGSVLAESVSIDSRQVGTRAVFFALAGDHTDGHRFVAPAIAAGAVVAVVRRDYPDPDPAGHRLPLIAVDSPLEALQRLAAWWRRRLDGAVIAVTGSNGKTIVKDALVRLIGSRYAAAGTLGSYNSQLGVPLAVLRIPRSVDFAVLETGVSAPGDMAPLERILRPDMGILTNIGLAHIAAFSSRRAIAGEKLALFGRIPAAGWVLLPAGVDVLDPLPFPLACRQLRFGGSGASPEVPFVEHATPSPQGYRVTVRFPSGAVHDIQTATPSLEIVSDLEATIAASHLLGLADGDIASALQSFTPSHTRMEIWRSATQDITLVNDACSSDPVSVRAALRCLTNLAERRGRRVFVFGGMRGLGNLDRREHAAIGRLAADHQVDHLVLVTDGGPDTAATEEAFRSARPAATVERCSRIDQLRDHLGHQLRSGDVVLFKGPRNLGIDRAARAVLDAISPNRLVVDLQAIAENIRVFRGLVGRDRRILAMVKALAYGSDVSRLGVELQRLGVDFLGVATAAEGESLRRAGVDLPILVTLCTPESAPVIAAHGLTPVIHSPGLVEPLAAAARTADRPLDVHLKVDTGMGRLGVFPDDLPALARQALATGQLRVVGLMTHFASAESPEQDDFTKLQLERFARARDRLAELGLTGLLSHAANTAAAVRHPQSRLDMVRIGIGLYGVYPSPAVAEEVELTLAVKLLTRVTDVRPFPAGARLGYGGTFVVPRDGFRAAVLPIGYHDGIPWSSSNSGFVLVAGQQAPIVGRVSMDSTIIDVSHIPEAGEGSDVLVYGSHDGSTLRPEEVATASGTMAYELLSRVSGHRIQRIFVGV